MRALAVGFWLVSMTTSLAVTGVAVGLWVRDVVRKQDLDGVEPSPVTFRSALYSLLAGLVLWGTRLARGEPLSFNDLAFSALLIGFGLSAGWYLLARRTADGPSARTVARISAVIASSHGALAALAYP
jgi:hypothetical protein